MNYNVNERNHYILCETLDGSTHYEQLRGKLKIEEYYNQSVINDGRLVVYIGELDNLNEHKTNAQRYALKELPLDVAPEYYVLANSTYDRALMGPVE